MEVIDNKNRNKKSFNALYKLYIFTSNIRTSELLAICIAIRILKLASASGCVSSNRNVSSFLH